KDKRVVISGSGNVAQYAVEKCIEIGAKVLTVSDSSGYIYDAEGINTEKLEYIMELKNVKRARINEYLNAYPNAKFVEGKTPWEIACDIALPCATQNELNEEDAKVLLKNGCFRSEEHTSELQSRENLVCRLLLEKKKNVRNKDEQTNNI